MAVKRISKETETKLVDCVEKLSSAVEEGSTPTEGLVKVAREADLGPNLVRLVAQAFNNGRTNAQRKSADDLFDKSASFPLADAGVAIKELYPDHVKTAAESHRDSTVSDDYASPPPMTGRRFVKSAMALPPLTDRPPETYPRETGRHEKRAYSLAGELDREVQERRRLAGVSRDKLAAAFGDLRIYFRQVGSTVPIKQAAVNSRLLFGRAADVVFRQLAEDDSLVKNASAGKEPSPTAARPDRPPYSLVGDCIRLARECRSAGEDLDGFRKQAAAAVGSINDRIAPAKPNHQGSILKAMTKQAVIGSFVAGNLLGGAAQAAGTETFQRVMPRELDKAKGDAFLDLTSPEHEADLRNVRAQAVLHDVMANDEYLSGEHPEKVIRMYNEITKLSPRAAEQPMLMRSLLRRYMQQATVEPHDINQQLEIENQIKSRDKPLGGFDLPPSVGTSFAAAPKKE